MMYSNELDHIYDQWPVIQSRILKYLQTETELASEDTEAVIQALGSIDPRDERAIRDFVLGFLASRGNLSPEWLFSGSGRSINNMAQLQEAVRTAEEQFQQLAESIKERDKVFEKFVLNDPKVKAVLDPFILEQLAVKLEPLPSKIID